METMVVVTGVDSPQIYGKGDEAEGVSTQKVENREPNPEDDGDIDFIQ